MLDLASWIVSAAVPLAIAALAGWLAIGLGVRPAADSGNLSKANSRSGFAAPLVLSLGWAAAVTAGLIGQRISQGADGSHWWPEDYDFWQRGYWAIWAAAVLMGATAGVRWRDLPFRWVVAGLLAIGTAAVSVPGGESWIDMLPLHQGWMSLLASTCLLNIWSLDRLSATAADRWFPLVVLATLAGPMTVAAATYMGLVQWTIAAVVATLPIVLFAMLGWIDSRTAVGIAYPAVAFATIMTAAGRFSSYDDLPWWSYLGMLLVPTAIALVDFPLRKRHGAIRAAFAAVTALLLIGLSAWLQYRPGDSGAEW
jgi:hypothetical protein